MKRFAVAIGALVVPLALLTGCETFSTVAQNPGVLLDPGKMLVLADEAKKEIADFNLAQIRKYCERTPVEKRLALRDMHSTELGPVVQINCDNLPVLPETTAAVPEVTAAGTIAMVAAE